jgi:hypothetical protein
LKVDDRFGLQLQALQTAADRVLTVADLVARRNEAEDFAPGELTSAFYSLHVPPPGNVSSVLGTLARRGHALRHPNGRWTLTPQGRDSCRALGLRISDKSGATGSAAEFAHTSHTVIPAWAAPPRWAAGIARLLDRHPFESNVLCMTRFPSEGEMVDPVERAIAAAREELAAFGLTLHLASDAIVEDDLLGNVGAYMWACQYGLGIVEDRVGRGLNYNAVIEVGGMTVTGRRCCILRDGSAPALPTDLAGQIYKSVDLDDETSVRAAVRCWASDDLGMASAA